MSTIEARVRAAYASSSPFRLVTEVALFRARDELAVGPRTRVYAICEEDGGAWKFGVARDPHERLGALGIGNPRRLRLYAHAPGTVELERAIHYVLRREQLTGEWFRESRRTLVVADLVKSAQEQCADLERFEMEPTFARDAIACLTSRAEEVLVAPLRLLPGVELVSPARGTEA